MKDSEQLQISNACTATGAPPNAFTPVPRRMRTLPTRRGFIVPWFVQMVNGEYDFRIVDPRKIARAVNERRCFLCGDTLGRYLAFIVGPMCTINRISAEPPSHRDCAEYALRVCPFLTLREPQRREAGLAEIAAIDPAGYMVKRNPGAMVLWICEQYRLVQAAKNPIASGAIGVLFQMATPLQVVWFYKGEKATRAQVWESLETGLPTLINRCDMRPTTRATSKDFDALKVAVANAWQWMPVDGTKVGSPEDLMRASLERWRAGDIPK